jgi:16S rRNA (uracil1498-N3)-methyltransferase
VILFYSNIIEDGHLILTGEEHMHCAKVLRRASGDQIHITDGKGMIYTCTIIETTRSQTTAKILESVSSPPLSERFAIGLAILKNSSRTEWFVEKAVEIGISDIYFYQTSRTEGKTLNASRIQKIIVSAGKQSLNVHFPIIHFSTSFKDLLEEVSDSFSSRFIAHCNGIESHLSNHLKTPASTILLIGPEGDFTEVEITEAKKNGFLEVHLGSSRLRSETAALVGLMSMHLARIR